MNIDNIKPGTPWWDYIPASCDCGAANFPAVDLKVATAEEALWEMEKADVDPYNVGGCPYAKQGMVCPSHPHGEVMPDFDSDDFRRTTLPEYARREGPTWDGRTPEDVRSKPTKVSMKRDLIRALSG